MIGSRESRYRVKFSEAGEVGLTGLAEAGVIAQVEDFARFAGSST